MEAHSSVLPPEAERLPVPTASPSAHPPPNLGEALTPLSGISLDAFCKISKYAVLRSEGEQQGDPGVSGAPGGAHGTPGGEQGHLST